MSEVLVYIKPICRNTDNTFEYDFYFSETPEYVWGPDWDSEIPVNNEDLTPEITTCSSIKRVVSSLPFKTAEEISCYSMEYTTYRILSLGWVDLDNLDEYPPNRCVLHFGDDLEKVTDLLSQINAILK